CSAGNEPATPALHWAMTRSGTETMNSGAPIAGIDRRPLNKAGMDIGVGILRRWVCLDVDARHHTKKAIVANCVFTSGGKGRAFLVVGIDQPLKGENVVPFLLGEK